MRAFPRKRFAVCGEEFCSEESLARRTAHGLRIYHARNFLPDGGIGSEQQGLNSTGVGLVCLPRAVNPRAVDKDQHKYGYEDEIGKSDG